jgi:hypothetical protein
LWLRHEVDSWHLDCEIRLGEHDFIASVVRRGKELELFIPPSTRKLFKSVIALNDYLASLGLEHVYISE